MFENMLSTIDASAIPTICIQVRNFLTACKLLQSMQNLRIENRKLLVLCYLIVRDTAKSPFCKLQRKRR